MVNDIGKGRGNDWIWSKNPVARNVLARRQKSVRPSKKHSDEDSFYIFIIGISSHNHCTTSLEFLFAWTIFFCPHLFCSFKTHDLSLTFPTQVVEPQKVRDARDALPRCQDRIDAEHKDLQLAYFQAKTGWVSSTDGDGREWGWSEGPSLFRERSGATPRQVSNAKILRMTTKVGLNLRIFFFEKIHNILLWNFFFRNQANEEKEQAIDALEPGSLRNWIGSILEQRTGGYRRHVVGVDSSVFPRGMPVHVKRCQCQLIRTLGFVGFQYLFFFKHESLSKRKMTDSFGESFLPIGILRHVPVWHASKTWSHKCGGSGWVAFAVWLGWRFVFGWSYWNSRSLTS